MRIRSYKEALALARAAGEDAANRRMRKGGRTAWSEADHGHAIRVTNGILMDLGFDLAGWAATAGVPRNAPEEPPPRRKAKRPRSAEAGAAQLLLLIARARESA